MDTTSKAPNVPLAEFKRTKIIATIGPATNSYQAILALIKAGANGLRLNFSHGNEEERMQQIAWIRKAASEYGKPVAIIQDLQGPKLRLGDFEAIITVRAGQTFRLKFKADYAHSGIIPTQYDLSKKIKRGHRLYLFDGKVRTICTSVQDGTVHVRAENDGILIKRKGINLPDTDFAGDIITKKDKEDIAFGSTQDIDYVALSFVQHSDDIRKLRTLLRNLGSKAKIIAKIETKAGLENLEVIIQEADAVMIARGDLATETSSESVPIVQRQIIGLGIRYGKPTIVATQMLLSMIDEPEPTRAEVSDVATAAILGSDAVMLSEETATGKYSVEAVSVMKRIILYTQAHNPLRISFPQYEDHTKQSAISAAIINLADSLKAAAIVAETRSGATALNIATRRPTIPVIAVTNEAQVAQQLAIVYGAKSFVRPIDEQAATKLTDWLLRHKILSNGDVVVTASGQRPGLVGMTDTIKVRMLE